MSNFKYSLEICSGENFGEVYQLNRKELVVGRGNVDISIANPTLSSNHCLLRNTGSHVTVTDLQSSNGTAVNDKKIMKETTLESGDILILGEVSFRVKATTSKERLSPFTPAQEEKGTTFFGKFRTALSQTNVITSPYEKVCRNLLLLLVILSWILLLCPLYFIMNEKVTKSRIERACSIVASLAATNIEAMKKNNRLMVNSSIVDKEPGVSLALVMNNKGVVWAPESLLNKKPSDNYGLKAMQSEQLLLQQRVDGKLDVALPIKYYDFNNGQSIKVGTARILYDMKRVDSGPHWFWVVCLCSAAYLILAFYFSRKIVQTVKQDLLVFQEECEDVIKGNASFLEEKYSPEFNDLTVTFNRILRKLGKSESEADARKTDDNAAKILEIVSHLDQAALLVNTRNIVVNSSSGVQEILDIESEVINNKSMLEIHCEQVFYQDLLEFACEATQNDTKMEVTLPTNTQSDLHVTAIPVANEYSLILLGSKTHALT